MRILVADDDKFFRTVMTQILEGAGYEVIVASTGKEALEKALAGKPDLIILDVILPELLGTEVTRKLRRFARTAPVPILLTSSGIKEIEAADGDPKEFLADDFIHKPFRPEKLLEKVKRLTQAASAFAGAGQPQSLTMKLGRERRVHPRLPIDVEVTARSAESLLYHPMINISTGGIYLEADRPRSRDEVLELRFAIPETEGLVAAEGRVAWCLEIEQGQRWAVGIRFTNIAPEALERIRRYVDTLIKLVRPEGAPEIEVDGPAAKVVPLKMGGKMGDGDGK